MFIGVKLQKSTDSDILKFLEGKQNQTTIKLALREYMENHKEENAPDKPFWAELEEEEN